MNSRTQQLPPQLHTKPNTTTSPSANSLIKGSSSHQDLSHIPNRPPKRVLDMVCLRNTQSIPEGNAALIAMHPNISPSACHLPRQQLPANIPLRWRLAILGLPWRCLTALSSAHTSRGCGVGALHNSHGGRSSTDHTTNIFHIKSRNLSLAIMMEYAQQLRQFPHSLDPQLLASSIDSNFSFMMGKV